MTRTHLPNQSAQEEPAKTAGAPSSGAPDNKPNQDGHSGFLHRWMMTLCLVAMGGALLFVMWRGQSLSSVAWLMLPLAFCLGIHLLIHRHLGHHQRDQDE